MKPIALLFVALSLAPISAAQALPDNPAPAPPDAAWNRLQSLANGRPIVVSNTNGPPVHCLFAGITDAYLYCNPPGNPAGAGFRFDRSDVLGVDLDLLVPAQAQWKQQERNYHPAWISSMIAGGIIVGLCATRATDAGQAAEAGLVGAVVVGAIGAPLAFLPHTQNAFGTPASRQYGIGFPLRLGMHAH
jgi:uncharacterized membrane protein YeaQ/YmgE (transglycosylase-associated protein family)